MAQYKCKYFKIKELVCPILLKNISENILWMMFDDRLLRCADLIKEKYGAITINVGDLVDCGLRDINSKTGARYSAHKLGRALDLHIDSIEKKKLSKEEKIKEYNIVRKELLEDERFNCLSFENNISWLHIDTYNRINRLFNP